MIEYPWAEITHIRGVDYIRHKVYGRLLLFCIAYLKNMHRPKILRTA